MPTPSTELTDALLRLARLVGAARPLNELLDAAAHTIADSLGYEVAAIAIEEAVSLRLEVVAVHGSEAGRETLLGISSPKAHWEPLLHPRFDRGGAYFVPAEADAWPDELTSVTEAWSPVDDPEAWQADDALLAPMRRHDGSILGIVSVDCPRDARRPGASQVAALVAMTAHVAHLVESARAATAAAAREAALQAILAVSAEQDGDTAGAVRRLCDTAAERLGYRSVFVARGACGLLGPGAVDVELDGELDDEHVGARLIAIGPLPGPLPLPDRERLMRSTALRAGALLSSAAQRALKRSEARKDTVLTMAKDTIFTLDARGRITGFNRAAERTLGWTEDAVLGRDFADVVVPPGVGPAELEALGRELFGPGSRNGSATLEGRVRRLDGTVIPCEFSAARAEDPDGEMLYMVYLRDISERIAATDALRAERDRATDAARHDRLTGLLNRDGLDGALEALARKHVDGPPIVIGRVDVDGFAAVNESFGREVGDWVLVDLAGRLRSLGLPGAIIARTGSDEFTIAGRPDARTAASLPAMRRLLDSPLKLPGGGELRLRASCGLAMAAPGEDVETVLHHAKSALARAKRDPEGVTWYRPGEDRAGTDLALVSELGQALRAGEFELHYQPLVELVSGMGIAYEALLRWRRADGTLVPPGAFIPVAETSGLIEPIGEWVIDEACRQVAAWDAQGRGPDYVSINVSPRQLRRARVAEVVAAALDRHGLAPDRLLVEVTESAMAPDSGAITVLQQIRALGVRCALDDFGSDYSSLSRLARLPFDVIKLDRSFLVGVPEDPAAARVASGILELCAGLGLATVVEGIETDAHLAFARGHGAIGQGFLLGRPSPAWLVAPPGMIEACTSNASPAIRSSSAPRRSTVSSA